MTIQTRLATAPVQTGHATPVKEDETQPKRRPLVVRLTVAMFSCIVVVTVSTIGIARLRPVPSVMVPEQYLLSDGSLPATANCLGIGSHRADCRLDIDGKEIGATYDTETGAILRIVVSGQAGNLSDLILAWGTPTGLTRDVYGCSLVVFWGMRDVQIYSCALQPSSSIAYIEYMDNQPPLSPWREPVSPWRGFSTHN